MLLGHLGQPTRGAAGLPNAQHSAGGAAPRRLADKKQETNPHLCKNNALQSIQHVPAEHTRRQQHEAL